MTHSPISSWADRQPTRWASISAILLMIVLCCYSYTQASDQLAEEQAIDSIRVEADRQDQQAVILHRKLQDQCGGPEATVVERVQGGYSCLDKHGRKTKTIN